MSTTILVRLKKAINHSYPILIGMSLEQAARDISNHRIGSRIFVITDTNVRALYAVQFTALLNDMGTPSRLLSVPAGEKNKNRTSKQRLEDNLLSLDAGRDSAIIALGGGMVGDLAGFVAATLHRGIPYIQIPTTLLSQVDSSVGGKVAVDHPLGKNLIGAFFQPRRVYIDVSTLRTLSDNEFRSGIAEVIKYGAILDEKLFTFMERNCSSVKRRYESMMTKIVTQCCKLKKTIIEKDEKEIGLRRILNFGHTVGHGIETLTGYKLSHGKAISIGMVAEAKISASLGLLHESHVKRLENLLRLYGLPTTVPPSVDIKELFSITRYDKKVRSGEVHYTLIERIGSARIGVGISFQQALKAYVG